MEFVCLLLRLIRYIEVTKLSFRIFPSFRSDSKSFMLCTNSSGFYRQLLTSGHVGTELMEKGELVVSVMQPPNNYTRAALRCTMCSGGLIMSLIYWCGYSLSYIDKLQIDDRFVSTWLQLWLLLHRCRSTPWFRWWFWFRYSVLFQ